MHVLQSEDLDMKTKEILERCCGKYCRIWKLNKTDAMNRSKWKATITDNSTMPTKSKQGVSEC